MTSLRVDVQELVRRLLKLVPAGSAVDWATTAAAVWRSDRWGGTFIAHSNLDDICLDDLLCVEDQKEALLRNTRQFLRGAPANNALPWGARGTGKSSLIHALLNACQSEGLRLVEVNKESLGALPDIVQDLNDRPYRFVLFCDDLSFEAEDASYKSLKSALEGSVFKCLMDHEIDVVGIEGAGDEIVGARFHRLHGAVNRAVGRDHDDRCFDAFIAKLFKDFEAAQVRHHVVQDE